MNKDNIGQQALFFFITIFFVIGAIFAFSNRKKIVDFFKSKGILKSIRNFPAQQNVPQKNNSKAPSPLNNQNNRKRPNSNRKRPNNSSGKASFPKNNRVNVNEEKDDDDDDGEKEYRKKNQNDYSSRRNNVVPNSDRRVKSNSSIDDSWIFSFFKNIISTVVWLFMLVMEIIIKLFFFFFMLVGPTFLGFLIFVFILMTAAKNISFFGWVPQKSYEFCSAQIGKINFLSNFLSNHQKAKECTEKSLKFILRVDS